MNSTIRYLFNMKRIFVVIFKCICNFRNLTTYCPAEWCTEESGVCQWIPQFCIFLHFFAILHFCIFATPPSRLNICKVILSPGSLDMWRRRRRRANQREPKRTPLSLTSVQKKRIEIDQTTSQRHSSVILLLQRLSSCLPASFANWGCKIGLGESGIDKTTEKENKSMSFLSRTNNSHLGQGGFKLCCILYIYICQKCLFSGARKWDFERPNPKTETTFFYANTPPKWWI